MTGVAGRRVFPIAQGPCLREKAGGFRRERREAREGDRGIRQVPERRALSSWPVSDRRSALPTGTFTPK
jgi:hypothetical protein